MKVSASKSSKTKSAVIESARRSQTCRAPHPACPYEGRKCFLRRAGSSSYLKPSSSTRRSQNLPHSSSSLQKRRGGLQPRPCLAHPAPPLRRVGGVVISNRHTSEIRIARNSHKTKAWQISNRQFLHGFFDCCFRSFRPSAVSPRPLTRSRRLSIIDCSSPVRKRLRVPAD